MSHYTHKSDQPVLPTCVGSCNSCYYYPIPSSRGRAPPTHVCAPGTPERTKFERQPDITTYNQSLARAHHEYCETTHTIGAQNPTFKSLTTLSLPACGLKYLTVNTFKILLQVLCVFRVEIKR